MIGVISRIMKRIRINIVKKNAFVVAQITRKEVLIITAENVIEHIFIYFIIWKGIAANVMNVIVQMMHVLIMAG